MRVHTSTKAPPTGALAGMDVLGSFLTDVINNDDVAAAAGAAVAP